MDTSTLPPNTWYFILELQESIDKIQTIINHIGMVVDNLSNAQDEIKRHCGKPMVQRIDSDCDVCIGTSLRALDGASALLSKHQELALFFSQPERPTIIARILVQELNEVSGDFFAGIASIQASIRDIYNNVQALQNSPAPEVWWRTALPWVRDGLAVAGAILSLIPGLNVVGAALLLSSAIAGATHYYTSRRRRDNVHLPMAAQLLTAAEGTLEGVLAIQLGLEQTTGQALAMLDDDDNMLPQIGY